MAEHVAAVKIEIKSGPAKSGIKDIEGETKRAAGSMKTALSDAVSAGLKGAKDAAKGLLSDIKGVVSTAGSILGGVGTAELVRGALEAKAKYGDLAAGIRFAGGSAQQAAAAQKQAQQSAIAWAQDSMKVVDAMSAIRDETGSVDFAQQSIDTVSEAARGAHKSLEDMAAVSGTLNEKFGITSKELPDALADVVGLSEKGGVKFEELSERLGAIGAYAKATGMQGREGLGQIVGMLNVADDSGKNFRKNLSAIGGLVETMSTTVGKSKIGAALGVSAKDLAGNVQQQIEAIMKATGGKKEKLEKAFSGGQLEFLVDVGKKYATAFDATKGDVKTKTAAGAAALQQAFTAASKSTVSWASIQEEAAAQMRESPQKIATATEKLRQAFQSEQVQAAIGKLADKLPALAEAIAKLVGFAVDNPIGAAGAALGGTMLKGGIEAAITSAFSKGGASAAAEIAKGMSSGGGGLVQALGGFGPAVAIFAVAAAAFYAASEYEAKKEQQRREDAARGAERIIKGQAGTRSAGKYQIAGALEAATGAEVNPELTNEEITAMSANQEQHDKLELQRLQQRAAGSRGLVLGAGSAEKFGEAGSLVSPLTFQPSSAMSGGAPSPLSSGAPAAAAPAAPRVDMNALAQLQGQATGASVKAALAGQVLQVRVVGGNGPTAGGAVTAGMAPR